MHTIHLDTLDSTSLHARRLIDAGEMPDQATVITAAEQAGGVGRFGRPWASPRGGLWMTLVWPVRTALPDVLSIRCGVAALEAMHQAVSGLDARLRLKWPNDLVIDDRKVAGMLIEVVGQTRARFVLVGVGVNVNFARVVLPPVVHATATTLRDEVGRETDLPSLCTRMASHLTEALNGQVPASEVLAAARLRLFGEGRTQMVTWTDGTKREARVIELADDGRLRVADASGTEALISAPA